MAAKPSSAAPLYHIVQKDLWLAATQSNKPYFPPTYQQDGFIHLSADPSFLVSIGNHFYRNVPGDFLLLILDPVKLTGKVIFEPAAPVGGKGAEGLLEGFSREGQGADENGKGHVTPGSTALFPHLYGTIDYDAVQAELAIQRDDAGTFMDIPDLSLEPENRGPMSN